MIPGALSSEPLVSQLLKQILATRTLFSFSADKKKMNHFHEGIPINRYNINLFISTWYFYLLADTRLLQTQWDTAKNKL